MDSIMRSAFNLLSIIALSKERSHIILKLLSALDYTYTLLYWSCNNAV